MAGAWKEGRQIYKPEVQRGVLATSATSGRRVGDMFNLITCHEYQGTVKQSRLLIKMTGKEGAGK